MLPANKASLYQTTSTLTSLTTLTILTANNSNRTNTNQSNSPELSKDRNTKARRVPRIINDHDDDIDGRDDDDDDTDVVDAVDENDYGNDYDLISSQSQEPMRTRKDLQHLLKRLYKTSSSQRLEMLDITALNSHLTLRLEEIEVVFDDVEGVVEGIIGGLDVWVEDVSGDSDAGGQEGVIDDEGDEAFSEIQDECTDSSSPSSSSSSSTSSNKITNQSNKANKSYTSATAILKKLTLQKTNLETILRKSTLKQDTLNLQNSNVSKVQKHVDLQTIVNDNLFIDLTGVKNKLDVRDADINGRDEECKHRESLLIENEDILRNKVTLINRESSNINTEANKLKIREGIIQAQEENVNVSIDEIEETRDLLIEQKRLLSAEEVRVNERSAALRNAENRVRLESELMKERKLEVEGISRNFNAREEALSIREDEVNVKEKMGMLQKSDNTEMDERYKLIQQQILQAKENLVHITSECKQREDECEEFKIKLDRLEGTQNEAIENIRILENNAEVIQSDVDDGNDKVHELNAQLGHLEENVEAKISELERIEVEIEEKIVSSSDADGRLSEINKAAVIAERRSVEVNGEIKRVTDEMNDKTIEGDELSRLIEVGNATILSNGAKIDEQKGKIVKFDELNVKLNHDISQLKEKEETLFKKEADVKQLELNIANKTSALNINEARVLTRETAVYGREKECDDVKSRLNDAEVKRDAQDKISEVTKNELKTREVQIQQSLTTNQLQHTANEKSKIEIRNERNTLNKDKQTNAIAKTNIDIREKSLNVYQSTLEIEVDKTKTFAAELEVKHGNLEIKFKELNDFERDLDEKEVNVASSKDKLDIEKRELEIVRKKVELDREANNDLKIKLESDQSALTKDSEVFNAKQTAFITLEDDAKQKREVYEKDAHSLNLRLSEVERMQVDVISNRDILTRREGDVKDREDKVYDDETLMIEKERELTSEQRKLEAQSAQLLASGDAIVEEERRVIGKGDELEAMKKNLHERLTLHEINEKKLTSEIENSKKRQTKLDQSEREVNVSLSNLELLRVDVVTAKKQATVEIDRLTSVEISSKKEEERMLKVTYEFEALNTSLKEEVDALRNEKDLLLVERDGNERLLNADKIELEAIDYNLKEQKKALQESIDDELIVRDNLKKMEGDVKMKVDELNELEEAIAKIKNDKDEDTEQCNRVLSAREENLEIERIKMIDEKSKWDKMKLDDAFQQGTVNELRKVLEVKINDCKTIEEKVNAVRLVVEIKEGELRNREVSITADEVKIKKDKAELQTRVKKLENEAKRRGETLNKQRKDHYDQLELNKTEFSGDMEKITKKLEKAQQQVSLEKIKLVESHKRIKLEETIMNDEHAKGKESLLRDRDELKLGNEELKLRLSSFESDVVSLSSRASIVHAIESEIEGSKKELKLKRRELDQLEESLEGREETLKRREEKALAFEDSIKDLDENTISKTASLNNISSQLNYVTARMNEAENEFNALMARLEDVKRCKVEVEADCKAKLDDISRKEEAFTMQEEREVDLKRREHAIVDCEEQAVNVKLQKAQTLKAINAVTVVTSYWTVRRTLILRFFYRWKTREIEGKIMLETGIEKYNFGRSLGVKVLTITLREILVGKRVKRAFKRWWKFSILKSAIDREVHAKNALQEGFALIETNKIEMKSTRQHDADKNKKDNEKLVKVEQNLAEKEVIVDRLLTEARAMESSLIEGIEIARVKLEVITATEAAFIVREKEVTDSKASLAQQTLNLNAKVKQTEAAKEANYKQAKHLEDAVHTMKMKEMELKITEEGLTKRVAELERERREAETKESDIIVSRFELREREKQLDIEIDEYERKLVGMNKRANVIGEREEACANLEQSLVERENGIVESIGITESSVTNAQNKITQRNAELNNLEVTLANELDDIEFERNNLQVIRRQLDDDTESLRRERLTSTSDREFVLKLRTQVGSESERVQVLMGALDAKSKLVKEREAALNIRAAKIDEFAITLKSKQDDVSELEKLCKSDRRDMEEKEMNDISEQGVFASRVVKVGEREGRVGEMETEVKLRAESSVLKERELKTLEIELRGREATLRQTIDDIELEEGERVGRRNGV